MANNIDLAPRIQRLEDQFHEVNEKVHHLSISHHEALLILESYMKEINSMKTLLMSVKDSVDKIQMPDKEEWKKEMDMLNRITALESLTKTITYFALRGGLATMIIVGLTWAGLSVDRLLDIGLILWNQIPWK